MYTLLVRYSPYVFLSECGRHSAALCCTVPCKYPKGRGALCERLVIRDIEKKKGNNSYGVLSCTVLNEERTVSGGGGDGKEGEKSEADDEAGLAS